MDDICESRKTTDEARKITHEIDEVLATGGFSAKEWISNHDERKDGPQQERDVASTNEKGSTEKVVGLKWNPESDKLKAAHKSCISRRKTRNRND